MSEIWSGMSNAVPGSQIHGFFSIPDLGFQVQGSKTHRIPDFGSATLASGSQNPWYECQCKPKSVFCQLVAVKVLFYLASGGQSPCSIPAIVAITVCILSSSGIQVHGLSANAVKVHIQSISGSQSPCSTCKWKPKPILFLQVTVKVSSNQNHCSSWQWQPNLPIQGQISILSVSLFS